MPSVAYRFSREWSIAEYVRRELSGLVLTEVGSQTQNLTAASAGPMFYYWISYSPALSIISLALLATLETCSKAIFDMGPS